MDWWVQELIPVLDHFVLAAKGKPDKLFWASIVNRYGLSGHRYPCTGWIQCLFPYIVDGNGYKKNTSLSDWMKCYKNGGPIEDKSPSRNFWDRGDNGCGHGIDLDRIPPSISSVPFTLIDARTQEKQKYTFCAGITAISQDDDSTVRCNTGWAVLKGEGPLNATGRSARRGRRARGF